MGVAPWGRERLGLGGQDLRPGVECQPEKEIVGPPRQVTSSHLSVSVVGTRDPVDCSGGWAGSWIKPLKALNTSWGPQHGL